MRIADDHAAIAKRMRELCVDPVGGFVVVARHEFSSSVVVRSFLFFGEEAEAEAAWAWMPAEIEIDQAEVTAALAVKADPELLAHVGGRLSEVTRRLEGQLQSLSQLSRVLLEGPKACP